MMIVAEEHIVECTHSLGTKRGARELAKRCRSRPIFAASRVEGRVGEQPWPAKFEQCGGTANVRD